MSAPPESTFEPNPTIVLKDDSGLSLECYVEQTMTAAGKDYALLLPVDEPIELFAWEEEDEALVDVEDEDIDALFPSAKAVLSELNLTLQRSAYTLTAAGEMPEPDDDSILTLEVEDEAEPSNDSFQMLANFFHKDQQYTICTPLEPLLFFAQYRATGELVLLSPEEFRQVQPLLEDSLFDGLE
ncbi:MAG: DUF3727 domain-containing protein [Cyanobacteria bacterium P01_A01_bin.105]